MVNNFLYRKIYDFMGCCAPATPIFLFILFLVSHVLVTTVPAEVLERVVAIVNDDIILLSEFEKALESARQSGSEISREDVLDEMINRKLLLNEAKKYGIGVYGKNQKPEMDDSAIIKEYINRRIKAFIHIRREEIEYYYHWNSELFDGKELYEVRNEIEDYLVEKALSARLHEHIEELRSKAYIRIQLREKD